MKRVTLSERSSRDRMLHIEVPGGIITIQIGLTNGEGRPVTSVSVSADGDRYAGCQQWWIEGERGNRLCALRIIADSGEPAS